MKDTAVITTVATIIIIARMWALVLLWATGVLASVRISVPSSDVTVTTKDGQRVFLSGIQPSSFTACFKPRFILDHSVLIGVEIECSGPQGSVMTTSAFLEDQQFIYRTSYTSHQLSNPSCHLHTPVSRADEEQIYGAVCITADGSPLITCDLSAVVLTISQYSTHVSETPTPENTPDLANVQSFLEDAGRDNPSLDQQRSGVDLQLNDPLSSSGQLSVGTDQIDTDKDRETASADRVRVLVSDLDDDYYGTDTLVYHNADVHEVPAHQETSQTPSVDW